MLVGGQDAIQTNPILVPARPREHYGAWPALGITLSALIHAAIFWVVVSTHVHIREPAPSRRVDVEIVEVKKEPPPPPQPEEKKPAEPPAAERTRPPGSKVVARKQLPPPVIPKPQIDPPIQLVAEGEPVVALPPGLPAPEGEQDGGPPGEGSGNPLGSAPSGAITDSEDQPVTGPGFDAAYLHNPPPQYPAAARRLQLEGTSTIRVLVSPEGRPKRVTVEKSSGVQLLDDAALEAVQQWSFVPARKGNKAIAAEVNVPMRFHLTGGATLVPDGK